MKNFLREFASEKMRKGFIFLNSARDLRARADEKMTSQGSALGRSFSLYHSILSRAVLSQSTQPAKPIGFLGAGQPNPKSKSKS
jgi:hypothetical protein